jgi:3-dehydroquinate synthetase
MTDLSPLRFLTSTVTDTQSCHIFMGSIRELQFFLVQNHPRIVVIIDEGVLDIWRTELQSLLDHRGLVTLTVIPISEGESSKQLPEFLRVIDLLQNVPVNRRDALLIVGGGSCCDLGGTVATTFMRGIPYILVPTTLMAMVDAALGGKVAINLPSAKNLFGGFHTPVAVWVDIDFLSTLPGREIRQAFGEMIKLAVIADDPQFFIYNVPAAIGRHTAYVFGNTQLERETRAINEFE